MKIENVGVTRKTFETSSPASSIVDNIFKRRDDSLEENYMKLLESEIHSKLDDRGNYVSTQVDVEVQCNISLGKFSNYL